MRKTTTVDAATKTTAATIPDRMLFVKTTDANIHKTTDMNK